MPQIAELSALKVYFYDHKDKRFIRAVEDVGFQVERGTVLGMVGESGCGKTVTAQSMMGLLNGEPGLINGAFYLRPSDETRMSIEQDLLRGMNGDDSHRKGELLNLFHGIDHHLHFRYDPFTVIKDSEKWLRRNERIMEHVRGRNISMIFQNPVQSLNPFVPVGVQLEKTIRRFAAGEMSESEIRDRALWLLGSVHIRSPRDMLHMYARSLSVGIAQRVVIAIALSSRPGLLIADEPTSGLDTTNKYGIIDLLSSVREESNLTLILISHNIRLVSLIATHIVVMYAGLVVETGCTKDVIGRKLLGHKHPYTEALLSTMPTDSDIRKGRGPHVIRGTVPDNKIPFPGCPFLDRCSYATGKIRRRCRSVRPELIEVSPGHLIRCYRYDK
jgi:peptide/nickel transport system ATP-binding protein/oligopeptide transport system ATP-binding protein